MTSVQRYFVVDGKLRCRNCGVLKSISEFHQRSSGLVGYHTACKECIAPTLRDKNLRERYGISGFQYELMYKEQDGKCLVCCKPFKVLCVDHNYKTGNVSGLLCKKCNSYLGHIGDSIEYLERAIQYLKERR